MGRKREKVKTPAQLKREAEQKHRNTLLAAGVPEQQVMGSRLSNFRVAEFSDIAKHRTEKRSVLRVCYPNTVDKWLEEGGPGFGEPQRRAIDHCRALWACAGSAGRQVANYDGMGGGDSGRERDATSQMDALAQLGQYQRDIPNVYWQIFENMARDDFGAGEAGKLFAGNTPQAVAHAKASVGFVASLIAQWRRF